MKNTHPNVLGPCILQMLPKLDEDSLPNKHYKPCQKPYDSEPQTINSYISQETLHRTQKPIIWILQTIDNPSRSLV